MAPLYDADVAASCYFVYVIVWTDLEFYCKKKNFRVTVGITGEVAQNNYIFGGGGVGDTLPFILISCISFIQGFFIL